MKELLSKVVTQFVDHPDDVKVEETTEEDGSAHLTLTVNQEDMGKVIGKSGKIAKALRLMVRIPATRDGKRINLEILEQTPS